MGAGGGVMPNPRHSVVGTGPCEGTLLRQPGRGSGPRWAALVEEKGWSNRPPGRRVQSPVTPDEAKAGRWCVGWVQRRLLSGGRKLPCQQLR